MPEVQVRAVLFDMDGVLIDSGRVYARHWETWAMEHGIDAERVYRVHPGRPPEDTIRILAPRLDARSEADRFNATLADDGDLLEVTAMPGAIPLVAALPAGSWAIATSAQRSIAELWLAHAGLPLPLEFVPVDDVRHGKPAPEPYLQAARLLQVDPRDCLVIEDAPAGITAGKAAGATVLALRTTHPDADLREADGVSDDLRSVSLEVTVSGIRVSWS